MKKIFCVCIFLIISYSFVFSQNQSLIYRCKPEDVGISITLNKDAFLPYEPILVDVELKNISDSDQQFGPIDIFSNNILYKVLRKDSTVNKYYLWNGMHSAGWFLSSGSATKPNEKETYRFILNHYFDLQSVTDNYKIEIGFPELGYIRKDVVGIVDYKTETEYFEVKEVPSKDTIPLKIFGANINKIMNWNYSENDQLQKDSIDFKFSELISSFPDSYLVEPSAFYIAFYYMLLVVILF